jgi:hypothetical protein
VCAVDPGTVHAADDQVVNQVGLVEHRPVQCHHDANAPSPRFGSEQVAGLRLELVLASAHRAHRRRRLDRLARAVQGALEQIHDRVEGGEDVRLTPAQ